MFILVVCVWLVVGPCYGSTADPAPSTGHIAAEPSNTAGGESRLIKAITENKQTASPEKEELEAVVTIGDRIYENITYNRDVVSNNVTDNKRMESVANKISGSGEDWDHVVRSIVNNVTTEEKGQQLITNNTNTSQKGNTESTRNGNNVYDEEEVTELESNEMRNMNISSMMACERLFSVVITEGKIFANGSILSSGDSSVLYPPEFLWKDENNDNVTVVRGCICRIKSCIRKCCPEGQTLSENDTCYASNLTLLHPFSPKFIDENTYTPVTNVDVYTVYGNPCQYGGYRLDQVEDETEQFMLLQTGVLIVHGEGNLSVAEYCLEAFEDSQGILPLLCFPPHDNDSQEQILLLYPIALIISVAFLFATFFVYAVIPELRNLHGKSLMCHVSSLLTAYIFLAIVQLGSSDFSNGFCIFCAFAVYFSFLASFFWLNVMCFDIWWTFSGFRPLHGSVKEREYKKFVMYCFYAWGSPVVMLIVCIVMDLVRGIPNAYIKPEFGVTKCWFNSDTAILAYFYGPVGVLLFCNIILFITTACKIISLKKGTKMLKGGESKRHDDVANRQRFNLYLKLFIVMGVNWIMEVISWVAGGPGYLWILTDLGNTLQGVLIFIIFVWKQKVRHLLARRFCQKLASSTRSRPTPSHTSSYSDTTRTSLTSHDQFHMKPTGISCNRGVP